jgi:hypothetical protein
MYEESSLARNRYDGATSAVSPARFNGTSLPKLATSFALKLAGINGVQIGPGATPFTRIPFSASADDSERVKDTIAPLLAA